MEYANDPRSYAKAQFEQSAGLGNVKGMEAPRTISSAAGRIDELNGRLVKLTESISMISSQLGALSPVAGGSPARDVPTPSGAVYRLNNSADQAHMTLSEIENLVNGIARALG